MQKQTVDGQKSIVNWRQTVNASFKEEAKVSFVS